MTSLNQHFKYLLAATPVLTAACLLSALFWIQLNPQTHTFLTLQGNPWEHIWQLITTHLVHINFQHLVHNALGFVVVLVFAWPAFNNRNLLNLILICAVSASIFTVFFADYDSFVGLSAILYGLLTYALLFFYPEHRFLSRLGFTLLGIKLILDFAFPTQSAQWLNGAELANWSHLGGVLGGLLSYYLVPFKKDISLKLSKTQR